MKTFKENTCYKCGKKLKFYSQTYSLKVGNKYKTLCSKCQKELEQKSKAKDKKKWSKEAWKDTLTGNEYCPNCKQKVVGTKKVDWIVLIAIAILTGGIGIIFYVLYYIFLKTKQCPRCGYKFGTIHYLSQSGKK